jgi:hypothetical protein
MTIDVITSVSRLTCNMFQLGYYPYSYTHTRSRTSQSRANVTGKSAVLSMIN